MGDGFYMRDDPNLLQVGFVIEVEDKVELPRWRVCGEGSEQQMGEKFI